jgi:hypothetical protein
MRSLKPSFAPQRCDGQRHNSTMAFFVRNPPVVVGGGARSITLRGHDPHGFDGQYITTFWTKPSDIALEAQKPKVDGRLERVFWAPAGSGFLRSRLRRTPRHTCADRIVSTNIPPGSSRWCTAIVHSLALSSALSCPFASENRVPAFFIQTVLGPRHRFTNYRRPLTHVLQSTLVSVPLLKKDASSDGWFALVFPMRTRHPRK